ncbi:hypothetical protein BGZ65_006909 [Modicella reniformis]|uniref:Uncharacterized protein n=1 Tax=Modicella reniformis TaxID=1440133 RepID=A0A9P6MG32_9FUNG|nr:hypothetical protein BGZ65_006909 [Modicella reniformis]
MRTSISLSGNGILAEVDPKFHFLRRYGWSIEDLKISSNFNDQFAALLWESIQEQVSRIKVLSVNPRSLTTSGLNILDQIIRILPRSTSVQLHFHNLEEEHQLENTLHLLRLCKERVNHLDLFGDSIDIWLPRLAQEFPNRISFPVLRSFGVGRYDDESEVPEADVPWIVAMISTLPDQSLPCTRLEIVRLDGPLQPDDWRTVIEALDLSALKELFVMFSNFSFVELELLVNRIVDGEVPQVLLTKLRVSRELFHSNDTKTLHARPQEKAPNVNHMDPTSQWELHPSDLTLLKSYFSRRSILAGQCTKRDVKKQTTRLDPDSCRLESSL